MRILLPLLALCGLAAAQSSATGAQQSSQQPSQQSTTFPVSVALTTASTTITTTTRSNGVNTQIVTVLPTIFNVTRTLTPTSTSATASAAADSSSSSPSPAPIVLDTRIDPAFGVLGAILILTGLPSTFWGHKNRWTSFFLIGFYTLSLVCAVLIIRYGVVPAVNPPSKTLRGMFVLASVIAGVAGGGIAIFFWKAARYCIGAWGGLALGFWIECFHNGGLIKPVGYRWILYIALAVVGFTLSTIPKIHYHILLISTAFVGSSAFILGVDCYTTAGLKEFYMWNLGFQSLFPKFTENQIQFPVSQTMQIELGLIGAIALMGTAVQLRILRVLKKKLKEIAEEARKRDEEAELHAASQFTHITQEKEAWMKEHPTLGKQSRQDSMFSSLPLLKDQDGSSSPTTLTDDGRQRHMSGLSDFKVAPAPEDDLRRSRVSQTPGVLPTLDLGLGIQDDVPSSFIAEAKEKPKLKDMSLQELQDLKKKEELLVEIQNIRKSIEVLKSEPGPSSASQSRRPSMTSRRTLSIDASTALLPAAHPHARPPREADPRARAHSMEFSSLVHAHSPPVGALSESPSRPTSVPVKDPDWDAYIHERKLLQPPSGVTPPISTSLGPRGPMSAAVQEALESRKRRESLLVTSSGSGTPIGSSGGEEMDDVPLSKIVSDKRHSGLTGVTGFGNLGYAPAPKEKDPGVTILPPRKSPAGNVQAPVPQRVTSKVPVVKTFEELNDRHREKMRNLQEPVTKAEKESADVRNAKERWEKAKRVEKESMLRKQAEKVAALEKREQGHNRGRSGGQSARTRDNDVAGDAVGRNRHSRSLSADRLGFAGAGNSSKRLSVLKVEDWQKYQATNSSGARDSTGEFGVKKRDSSVPFPPHGRSRDPAGRRPSQEIPKRDGEWRKSKDYLT